MAAKDGKPSYEEARDELAEIVESLEDGSATLEESLKLWERGEELAKICQEWLDGARRSLMLQRSRLNNVSPIFIFGFTSNR
jgi:exodeoxyribonuclease VII small subunit